MSSPSRKQVRGSVQDFILLPLCIVKSKELGCRGSPRYLTSMLEISADLISYKKSLGRVVFGIILLLRLNIRAWGEHLSSPLSWIAAWLLVTRIWPVYLVDEYGNSVKHQRRNYSEKVCVLSLDDWANGGYVDVLLQVWWVGVRVSSFGSWSNSKEWVWNLVTKLCCTGPGK